MDILDSSVVVIDITFLDQVYTEEEVEPTLTFEEKRTSYYAAKLLELKQLQKIESLSKKEQALSS